MGSGLPRAILIYASKQGSKSEKPNPMQRFWTQWNGAYRLIVKKIPQRKCVTDRS